MNKLLEWYFIVYRFWMRFPEKLRFILVGGYNTVFGYLLFVALIFLLTEKYNQLALFGSYILSSINSYLTQKYYVFATKNINFKEYLQCVTTWMGSYIINAVLLYILVDILHFNVYIMQIICLIICAVFNYVFLKHFVFCKKQK